MKGVDCLIILQKSAHFLDVSLIQIPWTAVTVCPWTVTLYLAVKHVSWPRGHVSVFIGNAWVSGWPIMFWPVVHLIPCPKINHRYRLLYHFLGLY